MFSALLRQSLYSANLSLFERNIVVGKNKIVYLSFNTLVCSSTMKWTCARNAPTSQIRLRCACHLRRLRQIRRLVEHGVTATLASALLITKTLISQLKYGNAVVAGPHSSPPAPQRVLNNAAWLMFGLRPRDQRWSTCIDCRSQEASSLITSCQSWSRSRSTVLHRRTSLTCYNR